MPSWKEELSQVADTIIHHSIKAQKGDKVLIRAHDLPNMELVELLVKKLRSVGATPFLLTRSQKHMARMIGHSNKVLISAQAEIEKLVAEHMTAAISIMGDLHNSLSAEISDKAKENYMNLWHIPIYHNHVVEKLRWVLINFPTETKAKEFGMTLKEFLRFYMDTMLVDYAKMAIAAEALKKRMKATDKVLITGKDTHLEFSIKGVPARVCAGERNLPDGEVFTAPVRNSVNGTIKFNTLTSYEGHIFSSVGLVFDKGKIIGTECFCESRHDLRTLDGILNRDKGARYVGEFAIAFNPRITEAVSNILFDEKIAGSLHLTPGSSYKDAYNGNDSAVHWDMVLIQRPEHGGGEIWFDGELIRKDGIFVTDDLKPLNPENLK